MNITDATRMIILDTLHGDVEQSLRYMRASRDSVSRLMRDDFRYKAERRLVSALELIDKLNGPAHKQLDTEPRPNQEL